MLMIKFNAFDKVYRLFMTRLFTMDYNGVLFIFVGVSKKKKKMNNKQNNPFIFKGPLCTQPILLNEANLSPLFNDEQTIYFAGRTDGRLVENDTVWEGQPAELFIGRGI